MPRQDTLERAVDVTTAVKVLLIMDFGAVAAIVLGVMARREHADMMRLEG